MMNEEEESEEGFLNPKDLEVIDDETWEPTDEDVLAYAMKLGFDVENDPDELFEVAYFYLKTPLPEGWKRAIYKETGELMYINMEDGEIEITTEIEEIAHECYLKKKEEFIRKEETKKKEAETKIVPRTKIPPLNPNKNSGSSVNTSQQKLVPLSQSQKSGIIPQEKPKEKEKQPLSRLYNDHSNSDINFSDNSEKDSSQTQNKIVPVGKKRAIRDNEREKEKEKELEKEKEKEKKLEREKQLDKERKNYFDLKLFELKQYEKEIREKYESSKTSFDQKEDQIQQSIEKEYNNKLKQEKTKLETQHKEKVSLYESQLKATQSKEIEKHKKKIQKDLEDQTSIQSKDVIDISTHPDITSLLGKLDTLKGQISQSKKAKEERLIKFSSHKDDFNYSKQLLQESAKTDKNSLLKQHQIDIKKIESSKLQSYNKTIELSKQMITQKSINLKQSASMSSIGSQDNLLDPTKSRILENYSKSLDNDYQINCKAICQEYELSQSVEVQTYIGSILKEKEEKLKQYNKSVADLEKDYFSSLASLRDIVKKSGKETEIKMNDKFSLMLNTFNDIQKSMYPQGDSLVSKVIAEIRNIILQETEVDTVEIKTEELIRSILDEVMIQCHKMKNAYELSEGDYVYKSYLLRYLAEVVSHLIKIILETPVSNMILNKEQQPQQQQQQREVNDEILSGVIQYGKDKLEQYKFKYTQNKDKRIYSFLLKDNGEAFATPMLYPKRSEIQLIDLNKVQQSLSQKQNASERYDQKDNNTDDQYSNEEKSNNGNNEPIANHNHNDINCYEINSSNFSVPLLPDLTLRLLSNDELGLYSDITLFLKHEYIKLIEMSNAYNIKLNMLIVDKIRLHTEECFNYINSNISNNKSRSYFKEKLLVLVSNVNDYKINFNLSYDNTRFFRPTPQQSLIQSPSEDKMNISTKSVGVNSSHSNNISCSNQGKARPINQSNDQSRRANMMNVKVSNNYINSFNNFYTHYVPGQSLHRKMTSAFTHEFFNYKKNKYEVQSKLDVLKYNQSSSNI